MSFQAMQSWNNSHQQKGLHCLRPTSELRTGIKGHLDSCCSNDLLHLGMGVTWHCRNIFEFNEQGARSTALANRIHNYNPSLLQWKHSQK